ncbi:hypothetical protein PHMEG_00021611 [Phytophthora megakarya]|uniref:Aspartic protease n=1 Tax=Phytophthora megakarya TaxID=4795 RepID=A0A225VNQ9_9STRA|nr:hypothetical protein PHMEG_00021611 [Phytophthora megakarya]
MDFMVPAGIRLDLDDGSLCLPDEVRIQLSGRRQLFSGNSRLITFDQHGNVPVAGSVEIAVRRSLSDKQKLWVTRGDRRVPTVVRGLGRTQYLRITNVSDQPIKLQRDTSTGIWLAGDHVPRTPGYVSVGSRRYAEWQNLAFQATADETPIGDSDKSTGGRRRTTKPEPDDADHIATEDMRVDQEPIEPRDQTGDQIENHMAVLPEVVTTMREVTIDDIRVEDIDATPEGYGASYPPTAHGAICDIDVGNAKPVAQRCRKVAPQFREKLSMLIKGSLSATICSWSTLMSWCPVRCGFYPWGWRISQTWIW